MSPSSPAHAPQRAEAAGGQEAGPFEPSARPAGHTLHAPPQPAPRASASSAPGPSLLHAALGWAPRLVPDTASAGPRGPRRARCPCRAQGGGGGWHPPAETKKMPALRMTLYLLR